MVHVNDKTVHVNNKIIIEFGFRGISRIIEASVIGLNNSRYPAQPHPIIINYHTSWLEMWDNMAVFCVCLVR